ncbi:hypothetical protein CARUB_v10015775mg [Capsella rubella]|uniref:MATH domain-containing protein n=1 Tax=Capsella rubella TaxID=81985 RepID=R0I3K6_9BRAS|nr:hypothetical protein CARUB_v10015775mg [Capsella rubella]
MAKIVESKSTHYYPSTAYDEDSDNDETVDINGFCILQSQLGQAKLIFKEHPETSSNFHLKNELKEADNTIWDLEAAGFKLDWLKQKLEEIRVIVKEAQDRAARMRELDRKILGKMKELVVLEDKLKKEQLKAMSDELGYYYCFFI